MKIVHKIKYHYEIFYTLVILVVVVSAFLGIYQNWIQYIEREQKELLRDTHIINHEIESALTDATKLLDLARDQIASRMDGNNLPDEEIYRILHNSRKIFSTYIQNDQFALTMYLNKNGILRATNVKYPLDHLDLSDRFYFLESINKPSQKFAIGDLVIARSSGMLTFHISTPVVDKQGVFLGAIVQQISATELSSNLKKITDNSSSQIVTHIGSGKIAFILPLQENERLIDTPQHRFVGDQVSKSGLHEGVLTIPAAGSLLPETSYVGFSHSNKYGLITHSIVSVESVIIGFIQHNIVLLSVILLAFVSITLIFKRFYDNAQEFASLMTLTFIDDLTGLNNRRAMDTEFPRLWKEAARNKNPISALFIDIDHFKILNDTYGHENGDVALRVIAKTIHSCANRPLDFCCRWGGEEFVVILPKTDESGAKLKAKQILSAVRATKIKIEGGRKVSATVSIGIATAVVTRSNLTDDLIDMADKAMYLAKQNGRDQIQLYAPSAPQHAIPTGQTRWVDRLGGLPTQR